LRVTDLAVGYRSRSAERVVLRRIHTSVERGEMVCLVGPNGAGKSSFLRTVAGLQAPLAGVIEIDGVTLGNLGPMELARRLGVVLTDRVEVGALPAYRIVELGRYPHLNWAGNPSEHDHEAVRRAMDAVGVAHLATRDVNQLSDGERQRVMVARALAQEPVMLLLDEPTAFLDVASRVELMALLRRLAHAENLAVVLSTHDLELALRAADTIWLAGAGGELIVGSPEDLVMQGALGAAFESASVRFQPEELAFRLVPGTCGSASVEGAGLGAALAHAVLERAGYEVVKTGAPLMVKINGDCEWEATFPNAPVMQGKTFAGLAAYLRRIGIQASDSPPVKEGWLRA
jgi:iron complex transport system ATP-binding protein